MPFCFEDMRVVIQNSIWLVKFVKNNAEVLRRSDGSMTLGVTDCALKTIFLADALQGALLSHVLMHELTHAYMHETKMLNLSIRQEEQLCEFIAKFGTEIVRTAHAISQENRSRKSISNF